MESKQYPPPPAIEPKVEALAKLLFRQHYQSDPNVLEPGDAYGVDGVLPNGDPGHFIWREKVEDAQAVLNFLEEGDKLQCGTS